MVRDRPALAWKRFWLAVREASAGDRVPILVGAPRSAGTVTGRPGDDRGRLAQLGEDQAPVVLDNATGAGIVNAWAATELVGVGMDYRLPRKRKAKRSGRAAADEAYRRALGLPQDGPLPNQLGQQSSAGAARGGKGAASHGRGRRS